MAQSRAIRRARRARRIVASRASSIAFGVPIWNDLPARLVVGLDGAERRMRNSSDPECARDLLAPFFRTQQDGELLLESFRPAARVRSNQFHIGSRLARGRPRCLRADRRPGTLERREEQPFAACRDLYASWFTWFRAIREIISARVARHRARARFRREKRSRFRSARVNILISLRAPLRPCPHHCFTVGKALTRCVKRV